LKKKDLFERFNIGIPAEPIIEKPTTPESLPVAKKTEMVIEKKEKKAKKEIIRKRISLEEKRELFTQVIDIPFGIPETTLRTVLGGILDMKKGFWDKIFDAI